MILFRMLIQTVGLAFGQLRANKTRSVLTALGIIVGVASVAAVIASLKGMQGFVLKEFETIGAKYVFIDGRVPPSLSEQVDFRQVQLSLEEVEAIQKHAPSIALITPQWSEGFPVSYGEVTLAGVRVQGVWPEWHEIENR
ncbi:MAG: ABC transporter permease, partial [Planctomycetota bacterium]|nr:ABC transporter permease [Planctomycetota bacterium]